MKINHAFVIENRILVAKNRERIQAIYRYTDMKIPSNYGLMTSVTKYDVFVHADSVH